MENHSHCCILVQTTLKDHSAALAMAKILVDEKLLACVHISTPVVSVYHWDNTLQIDKECILTGKTTRDLCHVVEDKIKKLHPYELPEIIFTVPYSVSSEYNDWIKKVCR